MKDYLLAPWGGHFEQPPATEQRGKVYLNKWVVQGNRGKYTVAINQQHTWECSCPHWINTFPRKDCKHIINKQIEVGDKRVIMVRIKEIKAMLRGMK